MCISHFFRTFAAEFDKYFILMTDRERIEKVKDTLGLTARQFAAEIRVQPGTISNMMGDETYYGALSDA